MKIPTFKFPFYGIIIILSLIIGIIYIYRSLKKEDIHDKRTFYFFFMMMAFALIFGKLYTILTEDVESFLKAGLSSYGGLVGVVIAAIYFEKLIPFDNKLVKYSILSLPLVYGLSKIACTVVGCCGGIPYNGPLNVTYTGMQNIKQFPIQALEVIVFIIIFIICNKFKNKKNITYVTLFLCALFKFLLDFLRYDHVTKLITVNQIFSIILIVIIGIVYFYNKKKEVK